ncbi:MAG: ThuA domain-containing protein, partial [Candidatus Dormibacteraceae bacterium]
AEALEARECFRPDLAGSWDAIVCYDMQGIEFRKPDPPIFHQPPIDYEVGLLDMLDAGQGFVFLHHALSAWPAWPAWAEIVGGRWHYLPGSLGGQEWPASGYTREEAHHIEPIVVDHPICAGLEGGFDIVDEVYLHPILLDRVTPILRTDHDMTSASFYSGEAAIRGRLYESEGWTHPQGSGIVGWVKPAGRSPVVYLQPGHGPAAYANPGFRRLLANAVAWASSPEAHRWANQQAGEPSRAERDR